MMAKYGVNRRVVSKEELLKIEPAFQQFAEHIVGGTYTASDESGDARVFTQELAKRCAAKGVKFLWDHDVLALNQRAGSINTVSVRDHISGRAQTLTADHFVLAMGSYTAPLLRTVGVNLPIYPGKGYSATFKILKPELAPQVSFIDDSVKCAMSRLGDELRIAGTIEVGGYSLDLDGSLARARCAMLARRVETVFPGVCDTRTEAEGGNPRFWTGLRPATPTNIPFIGKTKVGKLWVNAGHGTLGWTHGAGSGKAIAELISGRQPAMQFGFYGMEVSTATNPTLKHA
jgi:D-amino-acid dehydrogenase